jgi:AcrR family transcriptional regulator
MAIDHEARRRLIATIAVDVIARDGLGAATIRRIASEARFSTAAVTHYFASKQELLFWTFEFLSLAGDERFEEACETGSDAIIDPLLTMTAWCPANVRRWKAYLAFWEAAARDERLAALVRQSTATGIACIERLLAPRIADPADLARAARLLNSIVQGISMQAIVTPRDWPLETIRATLIEAIETAVRGATR